MSVYPQGTPITLTQTFRDEDGNPTNPASNAVFQIRDPDDALTIYTEGDPEVTNPSTGVYDLALTPWTPGHYNYRVQDVNQEFRPYEGDFDVLPSPTLTLATQGFEHGPCTAWIDGADVAECCNAEVGTDTVLLDGAATIASQLLYELSGRLYAGTCERTVRPCVTRNWCGAQMLSRGHIVSWGGAGWSMFREGQWLRACGCAPVSRIRLSGYPVTSITEVKIDGDVVDPDTYRLDEWRFLTRTRDIAEPDVALFWPACQTFDLPDTEDGTFSVTYEHGADPPLVAQEAAKQLACQIYLACTGSDSCQLPAGTSRVTRQGITIERTFFARDPITGAYRTGLTLVDTFLNGYNPNGLRRRPAVYTPDIDRYPRPVGDWTPSS